MVKKIIIRGSRPCMNVHQLLTSMRICIRVRVRVNYYNNTIQPNYNNHLSPNYNNQYSTELKPPATKMFQNSNCTTSSWSVAGSGSNINH